MLGDYDVPVMYQDLANYTPSPMTGGMMPGAMMPGMMPVGMPMYGTSYLGGVQMHQLPERDIVELTKQKEQDGKKSAKLLAKIIGGTILLGYIPYFKKRIKKAGGIGKYIKNNWTKLVDKIKKIR